MTAENEAFYDWLIQYAIDLGHPVEPGPKRAQAMSIAAWLSDQPSNERNPPPRYGLSGYRMFALLEQTFQAGQKTP